ncbi:mandelate racemase/muconate lactonizing enzyme family protein [Gracilimonas sp.]|uniref:mandelate racemase/muconate lactonizing enzyme family protein n=1 Tax=Gracilimonas sp. TaxID=1974203 RepID=UPI003D0E6393
MNIDKLIIKPLEIPFNSSFEHSSAKRKKTQAVLVSARTKKGNTGLGEGCPRVYVTGETVYTCIDFFNKHAPEIKRHIHSISDLKNWVSHNKTLIDKNPSAWCAIELSILDALSKDQKTSVEATVEVPELQPAFQYSAVIGMSNEAVARKRIKKFNALGFKDFKVKISGNLTKDNSILQTVKEIIPTATIRLDANNLWNVPEQAVNYLKGLSFTPSAIEEPLEAEDFEGHRKFIEQSGIPVILDESIYLEEHLESFLSFSENFIINLRVSKMGGILRSLKMAEMAASADIPLIIGSQVGETSILTRAALTISSTYSHRVRAMEGAYGTLLLEKDVTDKPLMFGQNGVINTLESLDYKKFGFGIAYKKEFTDI